MTPLGPLENQIRAEAQAARDAIALALRHAANVGRAYAAVRDFLTVSELNAWLAGPTCPLDRHSIMAMRRISMTDLNANARTLADLMFDRAAEHIAEGAKSRSRSEQIEINRAKLQGSNSATAVPCRR
jgi:hypothetical protein